jgi:exo-beta-1,3-glucanase (GH17 family)
VAGNHQSGSEGGNEEIRDFCTSHTETGWPNRGIYARQDGGDKNCIQNFSANITKKFTNFEAEQDVGNSFEDAFKKTGRELYSVGPVLCSVADLVLRLEVLLILNLVM